IRGNDGSPILNRHSDFISFATYRDNDRSTLRCVLYGITDYIRECLAYTSFVPLFQKLTSSVEIHETFRIQRGYFLDRLRAHFPDIHVGGDDRYAGPQPASREIQKITNQRIHA